MRKLLSTIKHATVRYYCSLFLIHSFSLGLFLLLSLGNSPMLRIFETTSAGPCGGERFALTAFAILFVYIMILIRMLASTLKILRTIDWDVVKVWTFASVVFTFEFVISCLKKVMLFVGMITETFRSGSDWFASKIIRIIPCCVYPVFHQFSVIFLLLIILLLWK